MDATGFRRALDRLDYTQAYVGELFGYTDRAVRRWAANGPPPAAAVLLQLIIDGKIAVDDVAAARERARA
jgi:hypothetical protein